MWDIENNVNGLLMIPTLVKILEYLARIEGVFGMEWSIKNQWQYGGDEIIKFSYIMIILIAILNHHHFQITIQSNNGIRIFDVGNSKLSLGSDLGLKYDNKSIPQFSE